MEFKKFLTTENIPFTEADFKTNEDWLRINLRQQKLSAQFGQLQGLRAVADWDPMIQKALTFLPEAQALEDNAHKVQVQKAQLEQLGR